MSAELGAWALLVAVLIAFWGANRREVKVSFLAFDATVRIWIALLVSAAIGFVAGFLARSPEEISLADVVAAADGPIVAGDFGEPHADGACNHEGKCVLLAVWADVGNHMRDHLASYTLADMVAQARGFQPARPAHPTEQ